MGGTLGSIASSLGSLIGPGGATYADLLNQQLVSQIMGGKVNVLNNLNGLQNGASNTIQSLQGPLLSYLSNEMNTGGTNFGNEQQGLQGYLNSGLGGLQQFQSMLNPNSIPGMTDYFNQIGGEQSTLGSEAGSAFNGLGSGTAASESPLLNAGSSLLGGNTSNNALEALLQGAAGNAIGAGGYTPELNTVASEGQSLLQPNALSGQAGGLASSIFGDGQPVLPTSQVVSMALNQNATASQQQANQLQQQLLNRTGVGGPAVASGGTNSLFNDLQDQELQNQSSALQNALTGQQSLGLQQLGAGANLFNASTGANLGYTGQGLNALLQGQSTAGSMESILGNLGLGGGSLGLSQASTGGNLLGEENSSILGGLNAGGSLMNDLTGVNSNLENSLMGSQALGQTQTGNLYSALSSLLGQGNTSTGQSLQQMLGSASPISSTLADYIQQLTSAGTAQTGLYSGIPTYPSNIWQNIQTGAGGVVNPASSILGLLGVPTSNGGGGVGGVGGLGAALGTLINIYSGVGTPGTSGPRGTLGLLGPIGGGGGGPITGIGDPSVDPWAGAPVGSSPGTFPTGSDPDPFNGWAGV